MQPPTAAECNGNSHGFEISYGYGAKSEGVHGACSQKGANAPIKVPRIPYCPARSASTVP